MGKSYKLKYRLEIWDNQGKHHIGWQTIYNGIPNAKNLTKYIESYISSLKIGGINEHISKSLGYMPVPFKAQIINQNTGGVQAVWVSPEFMVINPARYKPVFTTQRRAVLSRVFRDAWADGRGEKVPSRRMRFNPIGMTWNIDKGSMWVYRHDAPKIYTESGFWYNLKNSMNKQGYNLIKKEMAKDGQIVSENVYYLRSRNMKKKDAIMIWDEDYAIRNLAHDYNTKIGVRLSVSTLA